MDQCSQIESLMWVFADLKCSKILLRRNISTQTMSVCLYNYCRSIIDKVKENIG